MKAKNLIVGLALGAMAPIALAQDEEKLLTAPISQAAGTFQLQTSVPNKCKSIPTDPQGSKPMLIFAIYKSGDAFVFLCQDNHPDVAPSPVDPEAEPSKWDEVRSGSVIFTKYRAKGSGESDPCTKVRNATGVYKTFCWGTVP